MRIKLLVLTFIFLFFGVKPAFASSVVINEIMYDLEGSDTDREWVELLNTGPDVDLTNWRFEESGTQHTLTLKQGSAVISNQQYAVIVDDFSKFLQDHPNFSGTVFDSSFSLSNTGENLKLRDAANGSVIDEVNYTSTTGANGDGNSLQRKPDANWIASLPTPNSPNANDSTPSPTPTPSLTPTPTPIPTSTPSPTQTPKPSPSPSISKKTTNQTVTQSPAPSPTTTPSVTFVKNSLQKNSTPINYRIASVAGTSSSATPAATLQIKGKKQTNYFWIGIILIFAGISSVGYIYLRNANIYYKFRKRN